MLNIVTVMPLNCTLKRVKMVNFMHILAHTHTPCPSKELVVYRAHFGNTDLIHSPHCIDHLISLCRLLSILSAGSVFSYPKAFVQAVLSAKRAILSCLMTHMVNFCLSFRCCLNHWFSFSEPYPLLSTYSFCNATTMLVCIGPFLFAIYLCLSNTRLFPLWEKNHMCPVNCCVWHLTQWLRNSRCSITT